MDSQGNHDREKGTRGSKSTVSQDVKGTKYTANTNDLGLSGGQVEVTVRKTESTYAAKTEGANKGRPYCREDSGFSKVPGRAPLPASWGLTGGDEARPIQKGANNRLNKALVGRGRNSVCH